MLTVDMQVTMLVFCKRLERVQYEAVKADVSFTSFSSSQPAWANDTALPAASSPVFFELQVLVNRPVLGLAASSIHVAAGMAHSSIENAVYYLKYRHLTLSEVVSRKMSSERIIYAKCCRKHGF